MVKSGISDTFDTLLTRPREDRGKEGFIWTPGLSRKYLEALLFSSLQVSAHFVSSKSLGFVSIVYAVCTVQCRITLGSYLEISDPCSFFDFRRGFQRCCVSLFDISTDAGVMHR